MIDADSLAALHRTFLAAFSQEDPIKIRRELLAAGWLESLDVDEAVSVATVFRIQGATCRDAAVLDDVLIRHLSRRWPEAAGDVAVAYPFPLGPGRRDRSSRLVLPAHRQADRLLWLHDLDGDMEMVELDRELDGHVIGGVDAGFGLLELSNRPTGRSRRRSGAEAQSGWSEALAAGRIGLSHQLISGARVTLERAVSYASARKQFGAPIGTFQAIKHRLAETAVAISTADAAAAAAGTTGNEVTAAVAKVLAGRAAATAARHCLQVFGGVGFTLEHEFHTFFRRSLVLDKLLGAPETLERELGRKLRLGEIGRSRVVNLDSDPRLAVEL